MDAMSIYKDLSKAPCHHCADRAEGCHCTCNKYALYQATVSQERSKRFEKFNPA